jgi:muramoyltetrapeptide carboxypeptidase
MTAATGIRFPRPLSAGDRIGVTSPSSGVEAELWPRLLFAVEVVERHGFQVVLGDCMDGASHVSASREQRAAELQSMLVNPTIRAVVPPWGGETAIDLLDVLDWDAIAAAEPTWVVGFSDISTLLVPLTLVAGVATVHGQNLMETPYPPPPGLLSWVDVVQHDQHVPLVQRGSRLQAPPGVDDWREHPRVTEPRWTLPATWRRLDASDGPVDVRGRLIGGCIETLCNLAGTRYLDVTGWADAHAPEGVIVYVEADGDDAMSICRNLHGMRLNGVFDRATAVLVGRTHAADAPSLTQGEAVVDALGCLGIPIVGDVECGHVGPHMPLVNGALARVTYSNEQAVVHQQLF